MSFLKTLFGQSNPSGATILNPLQDSNTNNINIYRQSHSNSADNVFRTIYDFQNKKKKILVPVHNNIFSEINNNRNRIKNHRILPIKSLLIEDKAIRFENFNGQVKIWLIFSYTLEELDYIKEKLQSEKYL